jgi:hypothetical protein
VIGGNVRWSELERAQPGLARLGREWLLAPGVLLVATSLRDPGPASGIIDAG